MENNFTKNHKLTLILNVITAFHLPGPPENQALKLMQNRIRLTRFRKDLTPQQTRAVLEGAKIPVQVRHPKTGKFTVVNVQKATQRLADGSTREVLEIRALDRDQKEVLRRRMLQDLRLGQDRELKTRVVRPLRASPGEQKPKLR